MKNMQELNCFGYILLVLGGNNTSLSEINYVIPMEAINPELPLPKAPNEANTIKFVCSKLKKLGFKCRHVSEKAEDLTDSEKLIAFWGFYPLKEKSFGIDYVSYDFHFAVRIDNRIWMHKWGWKDSPSETTIEQLSAEYQNQPLFFAVRKRAP